MLSRDGWKHLLTCKHFPNINSDDPESSAYSLLAPVALYSNKMSF